MKTLRSFRITIAVMAVLLLFTYLFLGRSAFFVATLLVVLEVTLSFDNAIVNAKVLERMNLRWQKRFLTWGILIAVFGTRFVLPILIVAITAWTHPWTVLMLALDNATAYGELLTRSDLAINAFGGMFLAMVAFKYFADDGKTVHWIAGIEKFLARLGALEATEVLLGLTGLLVLTAFIPREGQLVVLVAGLIGVVLFLLMQRITGTLALINSHTALTGLSLFLYLNVLDAAFSLDGVIGAFALTNNLGIIALGLGIGAYLVRSMTIHLVQRGTLKTVRYLEHGAHWAILGLASAMLLSTAVEVPEIVTGLVGVGFVGASYLSSMRRA